jgi:farnesyl-diphosphate farnesyltransferase
MAAAAPLLTDLLKQVARSFYLSVWVLPGAVRPQIGLAYLLARATDTIADTEIVPVAERLSALEELRARILGQRQSPVAFNHLSAHQGKPAERMLLARIEEAIALLEQFEEPDRRLIREVLGIITSGQELDLRRFATATRSQVAVLETANDLEDYIYRVAGCVGEFWTRLCLAHLWVAAKVDEAMLLSNGVRFGKGLQLVNVLRDLPRDLQQGRCYLPRLELATLGLQPADLRDPANEKRLRPLYNRYLGITEAHLAAGWQYTLALPRGQSRVRLACALPILIGIKTLAKLKNNPILLPDLRIKVSRAELRRIVVRTLIWYPWPKTWQRLPSHVFFQAG